MSGKWKIVRLTPEQADKLKEVLSSHQDEGPEPEGWQSDELVELGEVVEAPRPVATEADVERVARSIAATCGQAQIDSGFAFVIDFPDGPEGEWKEYVEDARGALRAMGWEVPYA